jgi:hypothetical protein
MHFVPCRFFSTVKMCEEASDVSWLTSSGRLPLLHGVFAFKHNTVIPLYITVTTDDDP